MHTTHEKREQRNSREGAPEDVRFRVSPTKDGWTIDYLGFPRDRVVHDPLQRSLVHRIIDRLKLGWHGYHTERWWE